MRSLSASAVGYAIGALPQVAIDRFRPPASFCITVVTNRSDDAIDSSALPAARSRIWFLRNSPIFEDQSESMYESLDSRAVLLSFNRGDALPLTERGSRIIYILMTGQVKLCSITEGGKEIILDVVGPGGAFGALDDVMNPGGASSSGANELTALASEAVAISKGNAFRFAHDYFNELVQRRPKLVINLTRILGTRRKQLEFRLSRLLYRSSLGKVAGLLSELGERYGTLTESGVKLGIRLTHQEMASIIGVKRETVSEALAELEYRELVETSRNAIILRKPEVLDTIQ